jgi:hypothetical protein
VFHLLASIGRTSVEDARDSRFGDVAGHLESRNFPL